MKITYAILNWNRDLTETYNSIKDLIKKDVELIVCSNSNDKSLKDVHYLTASPNVAECNNMILEKARELKSDYLFVLEDDMVVTDGTVFQRYVDLMKQYELGVVFYGFNNMNQVLDARPNPCVMVRVNEAGDECMCIRTPCSGVTGIDLNRNKETFDDKLTTMEFQDYIVQCSKGGLVPFIGFYFDIPKSFDCFKRTNSEKERIISNELLQVDQARMDEKGKVEIEVNIDKLLKYLVEKHQ